MDSLSIKTSDIIPVTPGTGASGDEDSPTSPAGHGFSSTNRQGALSIPPDQPPATSPSGAPALNPRSCVTCRRRKVRCDKQMPCSNCRRAQITCLFPAPGRAPRRPRPKDPNAPPKNSSEREVELVKRLRKLEGIVEELSGQIEVESGSGRQNSSAGNSPDAAGNDFGAERTRPRPVTMSPTSANNALREAITPTTTETDLEKRKQADVHKQFGRLVLHDKGKTSRYVSSAFWAKLNDELDEIRVETQALSEGTDDSQEEETPNSSPRPAVSLADHHSFILGYSSADVDLRRLHPLPSQIPFMWQVYQENVEPLIKILHIPTMEKLMRDMRRNIDDLTPGNEALLFSIYYAAITSMEDEEVQTNFGSEKVMMLNQYRFALEQALAKANFLNTSDMVVLQAFVLFLTLVRRHDDTRFCWTLTGLAIRMAQGLGIHRDGTHFGLPPFQIEMRRRLWWNLCTLDLRSAEELGTDLTIVNNSFDTQLPSNINDADIDPDTKEMPAPREGRSDCAVSLVRYEICALSRRLHIASSAMAAASPSDASSSLEERERMLIEVYDRVEEKFLKHCFTEDDPLFWMAGMVARVIMAKMGLVIYLPMLFPSDGPELSADIRDRLFVSAIEIVEYNHILNTDHRCRQWRWLFQTYRQWHAVAYVLVEVSRRAWTATSERGWEAVNSVFHSEGSPLHIAKMADHTAVWIPLRKLLVKANRHREAEISRMRANPEAAHQLDVEDRLNPLPERLGPVPGMEQRISQIRSRWRKLMRSECASPMPPPVQIVADFGPPSGAQPGLPTIEIPPEKEMDFMETIMSGPYNPGEMWQYVYPSDGTLAPDQSSSLYPSSSRNTPQPMSLAASPAMSGRSMPIEKPNAGEMLKQQALAFQTQQGAPTVPTVRLKDDAPPPWLWSDPFTSINNQFEGVQVDDVDVNMDGEEINWQNWQESIKDFEADPGTGGVTKSAW